MNKPVPAKGWTKNRKVRTVTSFDPDTFEEIRARAIGDGVSFAEAVRLLVEWGLESAPS